MYKQEASTTRSYPIPQPERVRERVENEARRKWERAVANTKQQQDKLQLLVVYLHPFRSRSISNGCPLGFRSCSLRFFKSFLLIVLSSTTIIETDIELHVPEVVNKSERAKGEKRERLHLQNSLCKTFYSLIPMSLSITT